MKKAMNPGEITPLLIECLQKGDIEGISEVYEEDAVLITGENHQSVKGIKAIQEVYTALIKQMPDLEAGIILPPIINENIALTSSILPDGRTTAEVARKQTDGSWKWCLDNPMIASSSTK